MKLNQSRIHSTKRLLSDLEDNVQFVIGIDVEDYGMEKIKRRLGLHKIDFNYSVFPSPQIGVMCRRNSLGEYISLKNLEKEKAYRAHTYRLEGWDGNIYSGTDYIPYYRYPRKFIPPKEYQLKFISQEGKILLLVDEIFMKEDVQDEEIKFAANLMFEIFNSANTYVLDKKLNIKFEEEKFYVPWEILPPGEEIWAKLGTRSKKQLSKSEVILVEQRMAFLKSFQPDQIYYGQGGYLGYSVYSFKDKNLHVFESVLYGNVTYIFEDDWEEVSKLSKKEILSGNLHKARIVHNKNWEERMKKFLNS